MTVAELLRARADDHNPAVVFEDRRWTYASYVAACAQRAALACSLRRDGPFHIGVLADNVPEFTMWLGGAALAGAVVVGVNPTRRGAELARDIRHTECDLLVVEPHYLPLLDGLDTGIAADRVLVLDTDDYRRHLDRHVGAPLPPVAVGDDDLFLLLFTSGTTSAPKACRCTHGRLARIGSIVASAFPITPSDVCYLTMPLFHSNALMAGWAPALAGGASVALRRTFSASGFLPDVRRYGATYFNYVGKPLSYILATPERPDDADNPLRLAFGNEAAEGDVERFGRRFGCVVVESYGSTEGGVSLLRTPDTPPGSLGSAGDGIAVVDPDTGEDRQAARFDEHGRLLNPDEAIGELVNRHGLSGFEGYWNNDEADAAVGRGGIYRTGDLAYRDAQGFVYFAGRSIDRLRVDGENFAAAPVARILGRHPDVVLAAVYAVPATEVGDDVMAALQLRPDASFDPDGFAAFLADQPDLGTKWAPRFVRVSAALPVTPTNKVLTRELQRQGWDCTDPVWWRPDRNGPYRVLTAGDAAARRAELEARRPRTPMAPVGEGSTGA